MDQILNIYSRYVLPFYSIHKQQARISVSAAIGLLTFYWAYAKIVRPPRFLRDIPQANFFQFLYAIIASKPINHTAAIALAASTQSPSGLYTRFDQNGWVVRITRPEAARKLLLKTDLFPKANVANKRAKSLTGRFILGDNILTLNGEHWKAQRKVANPAFHRSMPVDLFGRLASKMLTTMDELADHPIQFHDITTRITLDALGLAAFGFDFNSLGDKDSEWKKMYTDFTQAQRNIFFLLFPRLDQGRMLGLFPKRRRAHDDLTKFLNKLEEVILHKRQVLTQSRREQGNNIKDDHHNQDLLTLMLEAENEGEGILSDEELMSNLCVFFLAGHDTTANALNSAIYHMAIHKDVQEKARQEVIHILGDDPKDVAPNAEQVRSFTYIELIIKENLRINPPATSIFNRRPTEDTELGGVVIPKGTEVGLDVYMLHHNPTVWKDPETFDPERFRPGGEYDELSKTGMPWVPFSSGSRQCIGMNFSLDEQRVILPMLLRKYEWDLPADSIHKDCLITEGLGIPKPKNLYIQFNRRY